MHTQCIQYITLKYNLKNANPSPQKKEEEVLYKCMEHITGGQKGPQSPL